MGQRDQHRNGVSPFEPQGYVGADDDQRSDNRDDRALGNRVPERWPDRLEAVGPAEFAVQGLLDLDPLGGLQLPAGHLVGAVGREAGTAELLHLRVAQPKRGEGRPDLAFRRRLLELRDDPRARGEVDAEVETLGTHGQRSDDQDEAREREEVLGPAHVVPAEPRFRRLGPKGGRAGGNPRVGQDAEDRLCQEDRGEERDDRPHTEHEGEPLDPGGRQHEQDEGDHEGDDVGVDDRREALPVALFDRHRNGATITDFLLDAFEDNDVRVGGDADRQDQSRNPGERQGDRDQLDEREKEDRVNAEGEDRDRAQHAIEGEQEDRDEQQPGKAGQEALVEGLAPERRRYRGCRDQLKLDRQCAGLEQVGQLLRALDREPAGDLGTGRPADSVRVLLEVDVGRRDQLVVEDDREVLEVLLRVAPEEVLLAPLRYAAGRLFPDRPALVGEVEGDAWRAAAGRPAAEVLLGVLDVGPAQCRLVAQDVVAR